jgi:hypothetical protein
MKPWLIVHLSADRHDGTNMAAQTWRDVRRVSAFGVKADMAGRVMKDDCQDDAAGTSTIV